MSLAGLSQGVLAEVSELVTSSGLDVMGAFWPVPADGVPNVAPDEKAEAVLLIGNAGPEMWRAFRESKIFQDSLHFDAPDTLDRWTISVVGRIAEQVSARAVFPFEGPPYFPFQKWSRRADAAFVSPLGIGIHPEYGLWHAYRAALLFSDQFPITPRPKAESPCDSCGDRSCMKTCPVGAFSESGYDVPRCIDHLQSDSNPECLGRGCLARQACPVGRQYMYAPEQATFHMRAFVGKVNSRV